MDITVYDVSLLFVVMGLVSVLKEWGLPAKAAPIASLILGIIAGVVYVDSVDIKRGVLLGIVIGLSAVGFYSGAKNIKEAVTEMGPQDGADLN